MYELIEREPVAWEQAARATFRLPGFGGVALFMRTVVGEADDAPDPQLRVDVGLLAPDALDQYLRRPMTDDLPERLSTFFMAAASDWHPESSVDPVLDDQLGFFLAVTDSDEHVVTLLVQVQVQVQVEDEPEPVGINFQTSRAALTQAASDVRRLDHAEGVNGGIVEPPSDWESS